MDPNETLRLLRGYAEHLAECEYGNVDPDLCPDPEHKHRPAQLAEAVLALDTWLSKGGFLPSDWRKDK